MALVPVEVEYLQKWLSDNGYAEELGGYGHVSADVLAQALVNRFDIYRYSMNCIHTEHAVAYEGKVGRYFEDMNDTNGKWEACP